MPPTTDTDLKELRELIIGLREEVRVGFAQVDIKFAQVETKLAQVDTKISDLRGEVNTRLAEMKGDLKIVKQPVEFWDFVKRSAAAGLIVTVVGGLLLAGWKSAIFGTIQ
jgi:porphobilinogen deaminase